MRVGAAGLHGCGGKGKTLEKVPSAAVAVLAVVPPGVGPVLLLHEGRQVTCWQCRCCMQLLDRGSRRPC